MANAPLILLVDDFDDAVDIYATYLEREGFRVRTARNGLEAIAEAERERPDLVLLDLRMPVLDGTSALKRMRQELQLTSTPILALTAHALEEERVAALRAGFDMVIPKPCLPDELVVIVRGVLARQ